MRTHHPKRLLKYLLVSLTSKTIAIGITLSKTVFKLRFDKKTIGELHFILDVLECSHHSSGMVDEHVVSSQRIVAHYSEGVDMYSQIASFVCDAIPSYVVMNEGYAHKCECSMLNANLYILEGEEKYGT